MLGGLLKHVTGALGEVPGVIAQGYEDQKKDMVKGDPNSPIFRMKSEGGFLEE